MSASLPTDAPTWTDAVLLLMGVFLVVGFVSGNVSAFPVRVTSGLGSLFATVTLLGGMAVGPS